MLEGSAKAMGVQWYGDEIRLPDVDRFPECLGMTGWVVGSKHKANQ
jgi:hypothetical protein